MRREEEEKRMEPKNRVETAAHAEDADAEEHIHLPAPSWAPIIMALGLAGVAFGVVLGGIVLIVGALLLLAGLGVWIYDEIRHAADVDASAAVEGQRSHSS
jgi:cytochrome c oxidase subunit 1